VSLALTWPCRLCLLRVLLCPMPLLQAFPFPSTLGEVTLHPRCQACVFIYSSRGKWAFPPLLWSFPPTATFTSFPAPAPPSLARPALFIYSSRRDSRPPPSALRVPHPLCYVSFLLLLLITQFLLFSLGGGRSVQEAMLIWPRVVCGSTAYHLAHLVVCVFPTRLGTGNWWRPRGPPRDKAY
jgi:hypothetical protein